MAKERIHIERTTSEDTVEVERMIADGKWRTYCGIEIGAKMVWVSVDHVEGCPKCRDCARSMCKRCKVSYDKSKE